MRRFLGPAIGLIAVALATLVLRRLSRATARLSPEGLAESVGAAVGELTAAVRAFATDVRQGMVEHEATLREAAELDGGQIGRTAAP